MYDSTYRGMMHVMCVVREDVRYHPVEQVLITLNNNMNNANIITP